VAEANARSPRTSHDADILRSARKARRLGLFDSLLRIYASFPETQCDNCARCCFESPGVFFVEYLYLMQQVARMPRERRDALMLRGLGELLFSWIDPERQCIFLDSSRCSIYESRPLACRLFGLVAQRDREEAEVQARFAARQEADRLRLLGIRVPEAVIARSLVSCDRVRDESGQLPARLDAEAMAGRVARLDERLIPRAVVLEEFCFRSLPERLGAALLSREAVEGLRVQLLRRAQQGEKVDDLLVSVWGRLQVPRLLRDGKRRI
jgi:Fe-S-cluster containining protein